MAKKPVELLDGPKPKAAPKKTAKRR